MDLKDVIKAINVKNTEAIHSLIRIISSTNAQVLYAGEVKDAPDDIISAGWIVVEITRMDEWNKNPMTHLPIYNRPYRIVVI